MGKIESNHCCNQVKSFEVANTEKTKIKREGKKAKSAELLAARYHTTFENEMEEHRQRAIKEAERKNAEMRKQQGKK